MSSSSDAPQYRTNMSLMCGLIGGKKDTGMWLRGEMIRLVDPMLDSLFLRLIISSSKPSVVPNCRSSVSELCQLIEEEKDETNRLLRGEMDRLVNSLFLKLTHKFLRNTDWAGSLVINPSDCIEPPNPQSHQASTLIPQTSTLNPGFIKQNSIDGTKEYHAEILTEVKREIEEGTEMTLINVMDNATIVNKFDACPSSNDNHHLLHEMDSTLGNGRFASQPIQANQQPNGQVNNATINDTQQDWDEPDIKEEGDDVEMMQIEEEEEYVDLDSDDNDQVDSFEPEIREEFDDETNNGQIEEVDENNYKEESGDDETEIDSDNYDWSEGSQEEESFRSLENAQIETTSTHLIGQSQMILTPSVRLAKRTLPEEANNRDKQKSTENDDDEDVEEVTSRSVKRVRPTRVDPTTSSETKPMQIIIHALQCPEDGCNKMIDKDRFKKHMKEEHSIGQNRCVVKNCYLSFDNCNLLSHHISESHQHTIQLNCAKCDHHFTTYSTLSNHYNRYHQLGHFQCSFPECPFMGDQKQKIYIHCKTQHKTKILKKCQQPGCQYETPYGFDLKRHQQAHLGIKPYQCKWTKCDYASSHKCHTIRHIRLMHLARNPSSVSSRKPNDFVEVVRELL